MSAQVINFESRDPLAKQFDRWKHITAASILELREDMDNLREYLDTPHSMGEPEPQQTTNNKGPAQLHLEMFSAAVWATLGLLLAWNVSLTALLAVYLCK